MNDDFTLHASLAFRIHRLQRMLRRQFLNSAHRAGFSLTPEQFFLLTKLVKQDGQSQSELADDALQDKPNLTRMIADLERHGLIARRGDPDDGRRKLVHLTAAGRNIHQRFVKGVVLPTREALFSHLTPSQLAHTHEVFDLLEAKLS